MTRARSGSLMDARASSAGEVVEPGGGSRSRSGGTTSGVRAASFGVSRLLLEFRPIASKILPSKATSPGEQPARATAAAMDSRHLMRSEDFILFPLAARTGHKRQVQEPTCNVER